MSTGISLPFDNLGLLQFGVDLPSISGGNDFSGDHSQTDESSEAQGWVAVRRPSSDNGGFCIQGLCQQAPTDFELLGQRNPSAGHKSDKTATSRLKKQLQRGRKFLALCNALGTEVLGFVPEICVTRVDTVKLSELEKLKEGSMEKIRVREILSAVELCTREHVAV